MAIIKRPDFVDDWTPPPPGTLIKRAVAFDGVETIFDPPVGPDGVNWEHEDDFTTVLIETVDLDQQQ